MEDITNVDDFSLLDLRPAEPKYLLESMFASICHQFTCDTGRNTLIPSPSLHEAKQLLPLNVVTMKLKRNFIFSNIKEYSTYDIPLTDLLIDQHVPGLQPVELKYCSHNSDNTYSLNLNIGANTIQMIDFSFGVDYDVNITCNLGDLLERKIEYSSFLSAIKERKLNMNHPFIREIKDTNQVLCVIKGVIATSDKAEIKCTDKRSGSINLSKKFSRTIKGGTGFGRKGNSDRDMGIEPGTTLAYDVWELNVDVESGEITLFMTADHSGGFFKSDIQKIEKCDLEKFHWIKEIKNTETMDDFYKLHGVINDLIRQSVTDKKEVIRLAAENVDIKQNMEKQNKELKSDQKRIASELSKVREGMRTEESVRKALEKEKDELVSKNLKLEQYIKDELSVVRATQSKLIEENQQLHVKLNSSFLQEITGDDKEINRRPGVLSVQMFPEICLEVVNAIGGNTLIPSPSLEASMHLLPLNVVTMRKKRKMVLFYTKEYSTCDFSLTDLLIDKPVLNPKVIEHKVSSYSQKSTSTWCGMFGRLIKNVIGLSVNVFDEASITNKYGQLLLREIGDASFISALEERKLNLEHHFIQQIVKTQTVLCVVKGVLTTSGEVLVKETRKADMNIKATEKSSDTKHAHCEADANTEKDMVLNPGTTLAYKVWELEVNLDNGHIIPVMTEDSSGGFKKQITTSVQSDGQIIVTILPDSGRGFPHYLVTFQIISKDEIIITLIPAYSGEYSHLDVTFQIPSKEQIIIKLIPAYSGEYSHLDVMTFVQSDGQIIIKGGFPRINGMSVEQSDGQIIVKMNPEYSGGFSHFNVEDNVAKLLKDFKKILFPLHERAKAEDEHIKYSLLVLMTCSSDVLALSKILSKAEDGCLNEDKDTIDKQFINKNTVWSILTCVGVQTEDRKVLCEGEATPILTAVSYMIDAILELDNDFLNIIYDCDEQQLKTLLKIFESAVASSETISIDVDMSSVLKEPISSFLTSHKFTVCNDSIQPPKTKTCIVECIFCVLYCLSQN